MYLVISLILFVNECLFHKTKIIFEKINSIWRYGKKIHVIMLNITKNNAFLVYRIDLFS